MLGEINDNKENIINFNAIIFYTAATVMAEEITYAIVPQAYDEFAFLSDGTGINQNR